MRKIIQAFKKLSRENKFLLLVTIVLFSILFYLNIFQDHTRNQQFVKLAFSFLHGKTYFIPVQDWVPDSTLFNNHYYWPLGPLPAILLMPFVAVFGTSFQQDYLQFPLIMLNFFLLFRIAFAITKTKTTSWWIALGYIFGSAFLGVAVLPWSWQFAQIVSTTCILLALYEYFSKRRWLLIGIFLALSIATRFTLILASPFFLLQIYSKSDTLQTNLKRLLEFGGPIALSLAGLLVYNRLRFHNFFDQGYNSQWLLAVDLMNNRAHGIWSFIHFPANIFYFLLQGPIPVVIPHTRILTFPFVSYDGWGMSILITSPLFLWIFRAPWKNIYVRSAAYTAIFIAFSLFGYYGIGLKQFGYRYALDFYPFLLIILCFALQKKMPRALKWVITISIIVNSYFLLTTPPL